MSNVDDAKPGFPIFAEASHVQAATESRIAEIVLIFCLRIYASRDRAAPSLDPEADASDRMLPEAAAVIGEELLFGATPGAKSLATGIAGLDGKARSTWSKDEAARFLVTLERLRRVLYKMRRMGMIRINDLKKEFDREDIEVHDDQPIDTFMFTRRALEAAWEGLEEHPEWHGYLGGNAIYQNMSIRGA